MENLQEAQTQECDRQTYSVIKARLKEQQAYLKTLKFAIKVLSATERSYIHLNGRIREIESEIEFLRGVVQ